MGKVLFPLVNTRKDVTGEWHMVHYTDDTAERYVIPDSPNTFGYHTIFLTERPDNGSIPNITSRPVIDGYTEYTSGLPVNIDKTILLAENQFYVNYETGEVMFHPNAAGDIIFVDYWGRGSVIECEDINALYDEIIYTQEQTGLVFEYFKINNSSSLTIPVQEYFPDTGSILFTWNILFTSNLKENSITIKDITNNIVIGRNLDNTGSISLPYSRKTFKKGTKITFEISAQTKSDIVFKKTATVVWTPIIYYGSTASTVSDVNQIDVPKLKKFLITKSGDYIFETSDYHPLILTSVLSGEPKSITDMTTSLSVVMNNHNLIKNMSSTSGVVQGYNVYSSLYKLPPGTKIKIEV